VAEVSTTWRAGTIRWNDDCLTVSIPEAGKLLGYSRNTAYDAARRGELPTIRLGRKIRVPKAALLLLLDAAWPKSE
jgi:excisionase family DNA binding protein